MAFSTIPASILTGAALFSLLLLSSIISFCLVLPNQAIINRLKK